MSIVAFYDATGKIIATYDGDDVTGNTPAGSTGNVTITEDQLYTVQDTHYVTGGVLTAQTALTGITQVTNPNPAQWSADGVSTWVISGIPIGAVLTFGVPQGMEVPNPFTMPDTDITLFCPLGCEGDYYVTIDTVNKLETTLTKTAV